MPTLDDSVILYIIMLHSHLGKEHRVLLFKTQNFKTASLTKIIKLYGTLLKLYLSWKKAKHCTFFKNFLFL